MRPQKGFFKAIPLTYYSSIEISREYCRFARYLLDGLFESHWWEQDYILDSQARKKSGTNAAAIWKRKVHARRARNCYYCAFPRLWLISRPWRRFVNRQSDNQCHITLFWGRSRAWTLVQSDLQIQSGINITHSRSDCVLSNHDGKWSTVSGL